MSIVVTLPEKIKNIIKRENVIVGEFVLPTGDIINMSYHDNHDWYRKSLMKNYLRRNN